MCRTPEATAERRVAGRVLAWFRDLRKRQATLRVGSLITLVFNGVSLLFYATGSILMARALGPQQSGYVVWFVTGTTTIALFADALGINFSNVYLVANGYDRLDPSAIRSTVLAYGAAVGLAAGAIFAWIPPVRARTFAGVEEPVWSTLICLNVVGLALITQFCSLFWGKQEFISLGAILMVKAALFAVLGTIFAHRWRAGWRVGEAQVLATWVCALGFFLFLATRGLAAPRIQYLRACMRVGWRAVCVNWMSFLHQRIDQYFVLTILGPTAVGLYGVAVSLGEALMQGPATLGQVLFPIVAKERDHRRVARVSLKCTVVILLAMSLLIVPFVLLAPVFVRFLYGQQFLGAVVLLRYFAPAIVFLCGLAVINQHLAGLGYPLFQVMTMGLALALNIAFNLILLPRLHTVGAPISSDISYGVWLVLVGGYLIEHARRSPAFAPGSQTRHLGLDWNRLE